MVRVRVRGADGIEIADLKVKAQSVKEVGLGGRGRVSVRVRDRGVDGIEIADLKVKAQSVKEVGLGVRGKG
jgi:DNA-binding protein